MNIKEEIKNRIKEIVEGGPGSGRKPGYGKGKQVLMKRSGKWISMSQRSYRRFKKAKEKFHLGVLGFRAD